MASSGAAPGLAQPPAPVAVPQQAPQQQQQTAREPLPMASAVDGAAPSLQTEALLPGSSDEGSPKAGDTQAPALPAEEAKRRRQRRERWEKDAEAKQRWELQRRLVDISTDVEFLAREVERMRSEMDVPLPPLSELSDAERTLLESARRKRVADLLANHCKKTLGQITTHKWSWPFNAPVDLRQYPDYGLTVTQPMDFGTVKRRLDCGAYRHPDEFLSDVRLVFDNARSYNKPGSDVHVMANTLQERFEEKYAAGVAPRVAEEAALSRFQADEARRRHVEASAKHSGDALEQHCAVLVKYIDEVQACILDARSTAAALCKPVSRQEKEALVAALTSMPQAQFELAVGLVMSHHPGLQAYDDFGFDLDALDALTLRQMQSFVRACEAAEAEAQQRSDGSTPPSVVWPQLLLGSGLRPYRLAAPGSNKRQKKQHGGAAEVGGQQQPHKQQQPDANVKLEQQHKQPPPPLLLHKQSPAALQKQQQQQQQAQQKQQQQVQGTAERIKKRPAEEVAAPLTSTLTAEEVAAAVAAAGLISPSLPPTAGLPPAGSAVGPKPLTLPAAPALPKQQQQQQQQAAGKVMASSRQPGASPKVASSGPVPALAAAATAPRHTAAQRPAAGGPTAAQIAAVASAGPQQQHLLAQMHSLLSQVQMSQAAASALAAANAKTAGKQQQQQQQQQRQHHPQQQQQQRQAGKK
ncbi:hypothetical protein D9Q98_008020 [Chlorella vulgaris]|uniref:Uncharacterized protein n=1 Tax=Chlorella vulgaris TaxID=3077 RepID=A0A9D4TI12_CHLVU|nr:hypothetical protein D9Q98_008020 [Chlorella vulgaris]